MEYLHERSHATFATAERKKTLYSPRMLHEVFLLFYHYESPLVETAIIMGTTKHVISFC